MTVRKPAVGDVVAAEDVAQFADIPSSVSSVLSGSTANTISSTSYAVLPTTPVSTSLVLTRSTLVAISIAAAMGSAGAGSATGTLWVAPDISGALTETAADANAVTAGNLPLFRQGVTLYRVVPAGTLTVAAYAKRITANGSVRDVTISLVAIRPA